MATPSLIDFRLNLAEDLKIDWEQADSLVPFYKDLEKNPLVKRFKERTPPFNGWLNTLDLKEKVVILTVIALDQAEALFTGWQKRGDPVQDLKTLAQKLLKIEMFYEPVGGIIGYYYVILKILQKKTSHTSLVSYSIPPLYKMTDPSIDSYVREGLKSFPHFGEVYPVGGAGERLNLIDKETKEPLPQAKLIFEGKNLLEGLIRDLHAREELYYETFDQKITTPVALMTSSEKMNTKHIIEILEENNWFNRPRDSFFIFEQPLVPVITTDGSWAATAAFEPVLKPGGHGVLWLLMEEYKVFDWFKSHKREYLIVRQINNPLAGLDKNLLALAGVGIKNKQSFGFLSCERLPKASEGMIVLQQSYNEDGFHSSLTNIEYTEFASKGIEDKSISKDCPYSLYPANTNILFASIKEIKKTLSANPLPGMLFNPKSKVPYLTLNGVREGLGGRLESTMQNIADHLTVATEKADVSQKDLKTFALFNSRLHTISVTKRELKKGESTSETPYQAWLDKQQANYELFKSCGFKLPPVREAVIQYDPALGPLYSVIAQKVRNGTISKNSELLIEGSEIKIENLDLEGSLRILGTDARVFLKNVHFKNRGLNNRKKMSFWQKTECLETFIIECGENSEFWAEGISFLTPMHIKIPPGHRMTARIVKDKLQFTTKKISKPSWEWHMKFNAKSIPVLTFKSYSH